MPVNQVYQQMVADLADAQSLMISDYSLSNGERIRANKWAAAALLARVYLYQKQWADAEKQATLVINNTQLFTLLSDPNQVFLKNSNESILQLQTINEYPYATWAGNNLVPTDPGSNPNYYLTDQLLAAFEPNDLRKTTWVGSSDYSGTTYYYPAKYKVFQGDPGNITEYYTLLRLSEQYLIRAEARAQQNTNLAGAITDLNTIRSRAQLPPLSGSLSQSQVLSSVAQERRIELFAEDGHRWFDLKRTGQASSVLLPIKPTWTDNAQLWPIPPSEITRDPNLTQNPGY